MGTKRLAKNAIMASTTSTGHNQSGKILKIQNIKIPGHQQR
jgi:hypothetical protein